MANTVRFTRNGDYDPANSEAARVSLVADPTHDYQILYSNNGTDSRLVLIDKTTRAVEVLSAEATGAEIDAKIDGIYADFSANLGVVGLSGGDRGDVLIGGAADDKLLGQAGDDMLEGGAGGDYYAGGDGVDTVSFAHSAAGVVVSKDGQGTYNQGDALGDTYYDVERFQGSAFDDRFFFMTDMTVEGGGGADRISAIGSARVIASYAHSADGVRINLTASTASGGDAEGDQLGYVSGVIGSTQSDLLIGKTGLDTFLDGNGGLDTIIGSDGDDTIAVSGTWASVSGGAGVDRLVIRTEAHGSTVALGDSVTLIERTSLRGGGEVDLSQLENAIGPIRIQGRAADVTGTQADDQIIGSAGRDTIAGGDGIDTLLGGGGADTFRYGHRSELNGTGTERILDFSGHASEGDTIDLAAVGITGIHKGTFDADGTAQLRVVAGKNGFSTLTFDFDGDGARDASLRVKSDAPLTAADFGFAQGASPKGLPEHVSGHDGFAFAAAHPAHDLHPSMALV
jgi:Ca2+-binding RTX toxin-like protein